MIEQRSFTPRAVAGLARSASAVSLGIAFGVLTLWLQGHLEGNWSVLSNSGAVWTVVAVAIASMCSTSTASAVAAGTLALVGEVFGFYWWAGAWHGLAVTQSEQVLWTAAALVVGPFAGLAGHALARGSVTERVVASLSVAGLLAGEGLYLIRTVGHYTVAGGVEILIATVVGTAGIALPRASLTQRAGALVVGAAVAGAVLFVYTAPSLAL